MGIKKIILLIISCLYMSTLFAGGEKLSSDQKKARKLYSEAKLNADEKARIDILKEAIKLDNEFVEGYWLIAETYKDLGQNDLAVLFYEKSARPKYRNYEKSCFKLGRIYYDTGNYEKAREAFNRFPAKNGDWMKKCDIAIEIKRHPVPFQPVNLVKVNTDFDDYWPSITADGQNISITVQVGRREGQNALISQEDIYHSKLANNGIWSKSESLGAPTNTPKNEGAQSFSVDGRYMFFIACDRAGSMGGCDVYYSIRKGEYWSTAINPGKPLNTQFWETNPSFSPAGDELFFSSNRPGGQGQKDIWRSKVKILENGQLQFSEPENLGAPVNTEDDEFSPFIHADNKTLYFSSKGHPGLGGYDIFYAKRNGQNAWSTPRNIGYPINSHRDEQGFCVNAQGDKAYLASNGIQNNGRGKDIYEITLPEEIRPERMDFFGGKVYDDKSKKGILAHVEVFNMENNKTVYQSITDEETGVFTAYLPDDKTYGFNVNKKGYLFNSSTLEKKDIGTQKVIGLKPIAVGEKVTLNNIFFDFDKFDLKKESHAELDRLVKFLATNKNVGIELAGHTDIKGTREYNLKLSTARAKSVADYLLSRGVPADRITYNGYGPDKPIATNDTEEGRAQNRRTEVIITKIR